jgi:hypothetical protein
MCLGNLFAGVSFNSSKILTLREIITINTTINTTININRNIYYKFLLFELQFKFCPITTIKNLNC